MQGTRRNVWLLAFCQAMSISASALMIAVSTLIGIVLAPNPAWATVPLGFQYTAIMLTTFPASLLMQRIGRRAGFAIAHCIGIIGAGLCVIAIFAHSFAGFCLGSLLIGVLNSFTQYYRFAAADVADVAFRSRAIAYVLAGGVVAAFIGPNLAALTQNTFAGAEFAASYLCTIGLYIVSLLAVWAMRLPVSRPVVHIDEPERALGQIMRQPGFVVAVLAALTGYGIMNLLMTATPLAMHADGLRFADTAFVIQWHLFGMFVPSFFSGHLIRRFGVLNIMALGAVILLLCVAVNLHGASLAHFWLALVLLGLGWNFLFVGGTALLTETYRPAEKAKTQGLNDLIVFGMVGMTSFSSGVLHDWIGWAGMNRIVVPLIVLSFAASLWLRSQPARPATSAA